MRSVPRVVLAGVVLLAGCERSTPVQPVPRSMAPSMSQATAPGKPEIDPTYADGKTVYMIGPHLIVGARESQPELYAHAEELYLVVYPQDVVPSPGAGPITLTSGYQPQCNPCFHPGLPPKFVYHDHVISGAPGMGVNGTAGTFKAPWKIILLVYNPAYIANPNFTPITSQAALDAAEAAEATGAPGTKVFLPINTTPGGNPYEIETGNVLICPIVSSHA